MKIGFMKFNLNFIELKNKSLNNQSDNLKMLSENNVYFCYMSHYPQQYSIFFSAHVGQPFFFVLFFYVTPVINILLSESRVQLKELHFVSFNQPLVQSKENKQQEIKILYDQKVDGHKSYDNHMQVRSWMLSKVMVLAVLYKIYLVSQVISLVNTVQYS